MGRTFYDPTPGHISRIAGDWCASYSGGKDSTALVTWLEWCRRCRCLTDDGKARRESLFRREDADHGGLR